MAQIRIIQKSKNALQSGRAGTGEWFIEFEAREAKKPDPLMGWAGSGDTSQQVSLRFPTLEAAQAYAKRKGLSATVISAAPKLLKIQAYADNFR
jgi:hypothetical protein